MSNFNVSEFLKQEHVQEALKENNLNLVYDYIDNSNNNSDLTDFLLDCDINPIDYMDFVPSGCYRDVDISEIHIHSGIESIDSVAFSRCENLHKITFDSGVKVIRLYAFSECVNLREVWLPDSVEEIRNYAFEHCPNLTKIRIPPTTTLIGTDILYYSHKAVIVCKENSVAHKYAVRNKLKFELED